MRADHFAGRVNEWAWLMQLHAKYHAEAAKRSPEDEPETMEAYQAMARSAYRRAYGEHYMLGLVSDAGLAFG